MALVLDTSVIVAALDRDDPAHRRCVRLADTSHEDLLVPSPVLVEVDYWCRKRLSLDAWNRFALDVDEGAYRMVHPGAQELVRAAELEHRYAELDLGFVDASIIAVCESLGEKKVATLDRRDFSVVQPRHCDRLRLLPE